MAFTAQDVKTLREMTNVGMMDYKKALVETDGDMDKAVEWLREKGLAKAAKKAGRVAAEGIAYATVVGNVGVVIEVNSETDFAAKTDAFTELVKNLATIVAEQNPADVEALKGCTYPGTELTVTEVMQEKVMSIGENMQIRRFARFPENTSVAYVHMGGTHGVLVNLAVEGVDATEVGKNVAMQIAAMNPLYVAPENVPASVIDSEKEILLTQIKNDEKLANKPDAVKEKMVIGRIEKFYDNNCLVDQAYVKDEDVTVGKYTENTAKELGGKIAIVSFIKYERGEGIEKREDDLAAEVNKLING